LQWIDLQNIGIRKSVFERLPAPAFDDKTLLDVHGKPQENPVKNFQAAYETKKICRLH
jgi:hypothetical protein